MLVKDVMSKDTVFLKSSDMVSKFISLMESEEVHEIPVVDSGSLVGMIKFSNLAWKSISDPSKQKIKSLMDSPPPTLSINNTLEEASTILTESGLRALPVTTDKAVVGVISSADIAYSLIDKKEFKKMAVSEIMSYPEVLLHTDSIGKARVIMREKNISRLPIVDENGDYLGMLGSSDLLKVFGATHEKIGWYSMASEMERLSEIEISTIFRKNAPVVEKEEPITDVLKLMKKNNITGLAVLDGKKPVGVITVKDILEVYVAGISRSGIYYQISGLRNEDEFVSETIDRTVADSLKKIAKVYLPQFLFIHFKKHQQEGLRAKYSVRARLSTDKKMFISKSWAWDGRDAAGLAMDRLEESVIKWKTENRDKKRYSARQVKGER